MLDEISTVTIWVNDLDRALEFYVNILGLEKRVDTTNNLDGLRWLTVAPQGSSIELLLAHSQHFSRSPTAPGAFSGIVFRTRDMETTFRGLQARGVAFPQMPTPQPWGGLRAQFQDLDGNVHALVQEPNWGG
jgi:catechol 2,3-dioxygenase-like lactoylglutathione lyase family enzyme